MIYKILNKLYDQTSNERKKHRWTNQEQRMQHQILVIFFIMKL